MATFLAPPSLKARKAGSGLLALTSILGTYKNPQHTSISSHRLSVAFPVFVSFSDRISPATFPSTLFRCTLVAAMAAPLLPQSSPRRRQCAESCLDYLLIELVHHYRLQLQGPPLQVRGPL